MMNLKRIFSLIGLTLSVTGTLFAQNNQNDQYITFTGTADPQFNGQYVHIYNNTLKERHDSTIIANGTFSFKRVFKEPTRYMFYSGYEIKAKHGYAPFGILVDHSSIITIKADMDSFVQSKVGGSPAQDIYNRYTEKSAAATQNVMDALYSKYGKELIDNRKPDTSNARYKAFMQDYQLRYAALKEVDNKLVENVIRSNPNSFASIVLLNRSSRNLNSQKLEELYKLITPIYKQGYYASEIVNHLAGLKKSAIGSQVEDFTLNNPEGAPLKYSSVKAKYILIDFWGSWCVPCHEAFKGLRVLYDNYHNKGFEILGIATEQDKEAWIKDIKKERLPWLQMIDEKDDKSVSQKQFAVTQFPTTVLIDASGKIIGRDMSHELLEKLFMKSL
jgi:thiol-disulfide isomerase/thioredoxin